MNFTLGVMVNSAAVWSVAQGSYRSWKSMESPGI